MVMTSEVGGTTVKLADQRLNVAMNQHTGSKLLRLKEDQSVFGQS